MDRRQKKTRQAIFNAFTELLSKKDFDKISVGEIIDEADVGRATFYAHFETKDFLLKELCKELFCHIFDTENGCNTDHRHIFECEGESSVFLHLFRHLQKNDNNILKLLSSPNNELFLGYFKGQLEILVVDHISLFEAKKRKTIPDSLFRHHILSTFIGTLRWWIDNKMKETPECITEYFFTIL